MTRTDRPSRLDRRAVLRLGAGTVAALALEGCVTPPGMPAAASPTQPPAPAAAAPTAAPKPTPPAAAPAAAPTAAPKPTLAPAAPAAATAAPTAIARAPITGEVNFFGWTPQAINMQPLLDEFKAQLPGIQMNWTGFTSNQYHQQMTAIFVAGTPRVDALWLREETMGAYIRAGWIQPLDGIPALEQYKKLAYPGAIEDGKFEGKQYGLPYYTGTHTFVANSRMLNAAGIAAPPKSWDEFEQQLRTIRDAKILESPLTIAMQTASDFFQWVGLVYASGGNFFDDAADPVFDRDGVSLEILQRLVSLRKENLLDIRSFEVNINGAGDTFRAEQAAFTTVHDADYGRMSDPTRSTISAYVQIADMPSLTGKMEKSVQFTRQYGLGANPKDLDAAVRVVEFMTGYDTKGRLWVQDYLFKSAELVSAYPAVTDDPAYASTLLKWFNGEVGLAKWRDYLRLGTTRQALKEDWMAEWNEFHQKQVQEAILGRVTPAAAITASAQKARSLKQGR